MSADECSTVRDSTDKTNVCNKEDTAYQKCKNVKEQLTTVIPASIKSEVEGKRHVRVMSNVEFNEEFAS